MVEVRRGGVAEDRLRRVRPGVLREREGQRRAETGHPGVGGDRLLEHWRQLLRPAGLERDRCSLRRVAGERIGFALLADLQRGAGKAIRGVEVPGDDRQVGRVRRCQPQHRRLAVAVGDLVFPSHPRSSFGDVTRFDAGVGAPVVGVEPCERIGQGFGGGHRLDCVRAPLG